MTDKVLAMPVSYLNPKYVSGFLDNKKAFIIKGLGVKVAEPNSHYHPVKRIEFYIILMQGKEVEN